MRTTANGFIDALVLRLRTRSLLRLLARSHQFDACLISDPALALRIDVRPASPSVLPNLRSAMPKLFSLGAVRRSERGGPGHWLRWLTERQIGDRKPGKVMAGFGR
jgi:hypothetical protein